LVYIKPQVHEDVTKQLEEFRISLLADFDGNRKEANCCHISSSTDTMLMQGKLDRIESDVAEVTCEVNKSKGAACSASDLINVIL